MIPLFILNMLSLEAFEQFDLQGGQPRAKLFSSCSLIMRRFIFFAKGWWGEDIRLF
jgi:hypothetical protein